MIRSMTAYGRASEVIGGKEILVELKSVNNRYFDCSVKISRAYGFLEEKIKGYLQSHGIARGKVEVYVGIEVLESTATSVAVDKGYAEQYIRALQDLRDSFGLPDDISVMKVAENREVFRVVKAEEDLEKDWEDVSTVLQQAVDAFVAMREREGENLKRDLLEKKQHLMEMAEQVGKRSAECTAGYAAKLEQRLKQVLDTHSIEVDSQRILTECAIFADKVAVDEELVRLGSHFKAFDDILDSDEPVGRKLDFLLQEMNRETNTIGSKASDSDIAHTVVDMKCELEKIREQIQNLE